MGDITTDFITATKKIHADVRAVLTALHVIRDDIKVIREQSIINANEPSPQDQTANSQQKNQNSVLPSNSGQSERQKQEGENRVPHRFHHFFQRWGRDLQKPKFLVGIATLAFLITYTCQTRRANDLTKESIAQSQRNFILGERPYVWPAKIEPLPMKVGEKVMANVYSVNYGRTPAIHQRATGTILVANIGDVMTQADKWFESFSDKSAAFNEGSQVILPPGIPPDVKQYPSHITLQGGTPGDKHAIEVLNGTDFSFAIVGIFLYNDSAGNQYRTDLCMRHLAIGNEAWCPRHNEIH
jgi:hypothetical protein